MIDLKKIDTVFKKYVSNFDLNNSAIKRKYEHTLRVKDNCKLLANKLYLNDIDTNILILIGYLHDMGRFEQFKKYNSYIDNKTVDHADFGVDILFKDNLIRKFITESDYDNIIYKAVKYHNKIDLNYNLTEKEELFCKAIRDADKIDLLYIASQDNNIKDFYGLPYVEGEKINSKVKEEFNNNKLIDLANRKTAIDKLASILAFIYDLNLKESKKIITKELIENIINIFIKSFNVIDTSECFYLEQKIINYIEHIND